MQGPYSPATSVGNLPVLSGAVRVPAAPLGARTVEMDDDWKALGEEWGHGHPLAHRGMGLDEDLRASESFPVSMGVPPEQVMQHRMGEYGVMRRGDQRASTGPGVESFYNGQSNGAPYNGAGGKDEARESPAEVMRAMHEGSGHGKHSCRARRVFSRHPLLSYRCIATGFGMQAPNLANSLDNTTLGNYLTVRSLPPPCPWPFRWVW